MTQYILWSGGCDSTLLLRNNAFNNPNDVINAVTIIKVIANNKQERMEKKAREKLKKLLPKNIKYHTIEVRSKLQGNTWQMPFWLCYLAPSLGYNDQLKIAYLSSDGVDFFIKREQLLKAFNALMELQNKTENKLLFPFEDKTKGYVIEELKQLKLFKHTWYCGNPKGSKPCGKCMKCLSVKRWSKYPRHGDYT